MDNRRSGLNALFSALSTKTIERHIREMQRGFITIKIWYNFMQTD